MVLVETPVTTLTETAVDTTKAGPAAIETDVAEPQDTELAAEPEGKQLR